MIRVNFIKSNFSNGKVHLTHNSVASINSFESILLLALSVIHFLFVLGFHIFPVSPSSSSSLSLKLSLSPTLPLLLHIFFLKISLSFTLLLPIPFSWLKFSLSLTPPLPLSYYSSSSPVFFLIYFKFIFFNKILHLSFCSSHSLFF
jgi:hypothetical protein